MLEIVGSVPYKNNKERKKLFRKLRMEYGLNCKIWAEDSLLLYKYKVNADSIREIKYIDY